MSVLIKHTGTSFRSLSGPLSRIAKALGGDKDAHVLAIEFTPEQRHLEGSLVKAIDLLASMISSGTTKRQEERIRRLGELLIEEVELPPTVIKEATMRADTVRHLVEHGKWLTAAQIAKQGGYSQSNPAAPANTDGSRKARRSR